MPHRFHIRLCLVLLGTSGLFVSCVPQRMGGPSTPGHYAQTDSATSACLRTPACYAPPSLPVQSADADLEPLAPNQVDAWLREGLFHKLLGTLIPDVVVHAAGDLLKIEAVYDFKFPCPKDKRARWHEYHENHPFYPFNQQQIYKEAFNVGVMSVRPGFGATP